MDIFVLSFLLKFAISFFLVVLFFGYVGCVAKVGVSSLYTGDSLFLFVQHAFYTQFFSVLTASLCFSILWHYRNKKRAA
jgi:hypothetical protein